MKALYFQESSEYPKHNQRPSPTTTSFQNTRSEIIGTMDSNTFVSGLKKQIKEQTDMENTKMLVEKINDQCFERCILKPGSSFSSSEQTCTSQCVDKYLRAWNVIHTAHINRIQQAQDNR
ncbi:Tim10/DDP family zinc finger-domain-containing protein [Annulohypoxylon moriforme]|nr:Tim10/DDP family zinc finger-domain-containing protein [Annulohypoxylon moriforme]